MVSESIGEKTNSILRFENFNLGFSRNLTLHKVLAITPEKDTLIALGKLEINLDISALWNKTIQLELVEITELKGSLTRQKNMGDFNFKYLVDAFSSTEQKKTKSSKLNFDLSDTRLLVADFNFSYLDSSLKLYDTLSFKHLDLQLGSCNLKENMYLTLQQIQFKEVNTKHHFKQDILAGIPFIDGKNIQLKIDETYYGFENFETEIEKFNYLSESDSFDIENIYSGKLTEGYYSSEGVKLSLNELQFKLPKYKAQNISLSGDIQINNDSLKVNDLTINNNHSNIELNLTTDLKDWEQIDPNLVEVKRFEISSYVNKNDVDLYLKPEIADLIPQSFTLNTMVHGNMESLHVETLKLKSGKDLDLKTSFEANYLDQLNKARIRTNSTTLFSSYKWFKNFIPSSQKIFQPQFIELNTDSLLISQKRIETRVKVRSDIVDLEGQILYNDSVNANIHFSTLEKKSIYIDSTQISNISGVMIIDGNSIDLFNPTTDITCNLYLDTFSINNYAFHNYQVLNEQHNLTINSEIISNSDDQKFEGSLSFKPYEENLNAELKLEIEKITIPQTKKLKSLSLSGYSKISYQEKNTLRSSEINLNDIIVSDTSGKEYRLDFFDGNIQLDSNLTSVDIKSSILNTQLSSNLPYYELYEEVNTVKKRLGSTKEVWEADSVEKEINLRLNILNDHLLSSGIFPSVNALMLDTLLFDYNSAKRKLWLNVGIKELESDLYQINNANFDIKSSDSNLSYNADVNYFKYDQYELKKSSLKGTYSDSTISFDFLNKDDSLETLYDVKGNFEFGVIKKIVLYPKIILAKSEWSTEKNNEIVFNQKENQAISFQHEKEKITFNYVASTDEFNFSGKNIKVNHFPNLFSLQDYSANIDFKTQVKNISTNPLYDLHLKFDSVSYQKNVITGFEIRAHNNEIKKHFLVLNALPNYDNFWFKAEAEFGENTKIKADGIIDNFNLKNIHSLAKEYTRELTGEVSSEIHFSYENNTPYTVGKLTFHQTKVRPVLIGNLYQIERGNIEIKNKSIYLNDFVLKDSANNSGSFNAKIYRNDSLKYEIDSRLVLENFVLLDNTIKDNKLFHGKLITDASLKLTGPIKDPFLDADFSILKNSKLTLVYGNSTLASVKQREGLVEFVDFDDIDQNTIIQDSIKTPFKGVRMKARVNIDKTSKIKIIIDPIAGDYVEVFGGGNLNLNGNKSGNLNLIGTYKIESGVYKMSFYELVKKEFQIKQGSSINWYGDILNPNINVTAYYNFKTTPYPLVADQLEGQSSSEINKYKNTEDYQVDMLLKDRLKSMDMKFSIERLSGSTYGSGSLVTSKLNEINSNESLVNEQVFGILMFNSFLSPSANIGESVGLSISNSLSSLLSNQVNNLASEYVKGVDIDLGLNSRSSADSSGSGATTNLDIKVSKKIFNDRVSIEVGGTVKLSKNQYNQNSNFINDVAIVIDLDKEGIWQSRIYSKEDYDYLGEKITANGASLIYNKNFDYYKDLILFKKKSEKKKKEKNELENK